MRQLTEHFEYMELARSLAARQFPKDWASNSPEQKAYDKREAKRRASDAAIIKARPAVDTVLSGASATDVHLANLQDEQSRALDTLAMRPGYETAEHITTDDIIIAKYPAGEARDAWVKYWHVTRWENLGVPVPVSEWAAWEAYLQRTR